jgi:hypothetical protein
MANASQILFDVLGHSDIATTYGYAYRDPELATTIERIRKEVRAIRIEEALVAAEENGGGAAEMVLRIKRGMLAQPGKQTLGTEDLASAAAILGVAELVKPGVLCIAQPLERGSCSPVPGVRDVGACSTSCLHHLELAAHRQTRRKILDSLLAKIEGANLGSRPFFQGQIISNFDAFPDLVVEYENDPRLKAALSDCDPRRWAALQDDARCHLDLVMGLV